MKKAGAAVLALLILAALGWSFGPRLAEEALRWTTERGILNGKGGGILDPTGQATRAETAQMLYNFLHKRK